MRCLATPSAERPSFSWTTRRRAPPFRLNSILSPTVIRTTSWSWRSRVTAQTPTNWSPSTQHSPICPGTTISLDLLKEWFARIPGAAAGVAARLLFLRGMGAKVLHVDNTPRDVSSVEARLASLSGEGRLIITASGPAEPAYENRKLRHGFFTFYLLEALEGAAEVQQDGRVNVYRLLEYVTRRVIDAAAKIGRPQHPTMRGQIDGELVWPVFQRGKVYEAAFPGFSRVAATADVASLASFGFPPNLLGAWSGSIKELNRSNLRPSMSTASSMATTCWSPRRRPRARQ